MQQLQGQSSVQIKIADYYSSHRSMHDAAGLEQLPEQFICCMGFGIISSRDPGTVVSGPGMMVFMTC